MFKIKKRLCFVSLLLVVILSGVFLVSGYSSANSVILQERSINVDEIGNLSYEEKIDQLLSQFDVYSYDVIDDEIVFEGQFTRELSGFTGIQYVNTIDDCDLTQTYSAKLNCETEVFTLITTISQNDVVLSRTEQSVVPYYDESADDYFIRLDDGTTLSVFETLANNNLENCIAGVDDAVVLTVAALAVTIVAAAPYIERVVTQVVTTVVSWVRSFWSWFCSIWTQKTTTYVTTTVTEVYTPRLTIGNTCYKTKEVSIATLRNERLYPQGMYYLCFVSGGKIYISILSITDEEAVAILMNCYMVPLNNTEALASTFTRMRNDAYRVAVAAGLNERTPYEKPEYEYGAYHYHSSATIVRNGKKHSPHSFFLYY